MFGYFALCTSLTGYEPSAQLDDGNSNQFASAQDDTEKRALLKHCFRPPTLRQMVSQPQLRSVIPHIKHREVGGGNKLTNAGFHHKKRLSATEEQIARNHRRHYRDRSHEALHQQKHLNQEEMAQQPWEAEQRLRVEGTKVTAYTSTQLNAEFRAIENDASENDEFYQIRTRKPWIPKSAVLFGMLAKNSDYMKGLFKP